MVILDVFNLRGSYGEIRDQRFGIAEFDDYVSSVQRAIPDVVIIGILDGSAADADRVHDFVSDADQAELLRRANLPKSDPQFVYRLPQPRSDVRYDALYLHADPVCIHLLRQFQPTCALITHDGLNKSDDFKYLPVNDPLRGHIFRPWWAKSEGKWVFVSRNQLDSIWKVFRRKRIENREVQRVEDFFGALTFANEDHTVVRERAFGYVHDFVNEHRAQIAAQRKGRLTFGDTSRSRSPFDVLNPGDFQEVSHATSEAVDDELLDVGGAIDSDVLVRVATEQIDLIRSVDELQVYAGKRVAVQAMLQTDGEIPYLTWLGRSSRVKVILWSPSAVMKYGLVQVEGVLRSDHGQLTIAVASESDLRYHTVDDAVSARLARLVKRDIYLGGSGSWNFPRLPRRPSRPIPPPSPKLNETDKPTVGLDNEMDYESSTVLRHAKGDSRTGGGRTAASTRGLDPEMKSGGSGTEPSDVKPDTDLLVRRTKWRMWAWIATVCVVAAAVWFVLQTYVFAFEIPDPAVCANLESEACEAIVTEWQGDALRIHLYGTRGADGVVR